MKPKIIAAWVTPLDNGEIVWCKYETGHISIDIFGVYKIWQANITINADHWDAVVKVFASAEIDE